jgi:UDP-glucose 4-epimerase
VKVLITGGAGYIGATVASACIDAGHVPVILDDLSTGREAHVEGRIFYRGGISDRAVLTRIRGDHPDLDAVIHCAARIVVPESVADPLSYYAANVADSIRLLQLLEEVGVGRVVFSSSAAVYAAEDGEGVAEDGALAPLSPYARTKWMMETVLADTASAGGLRALSLRYFNPIGVDPALRTGPTSDNPTHVLGRLMRAAETGDVFTVTGTDWPTRDGSGVRDFVHVWDLAQAHVRAVERFDEVVTADRPYRVFNVGTGRGTTVRELVDIFRRESPLPVRVCDGPRRPGDSAGGYADVRAATAVLGWRAAHDVADGVRDALRWRSDAG